MNIDKKTVKRSLLPYLLFALVVLGMFFFMNIANKKVDVLTYNEFIEKLDNKEITKLELVARTNGYTYEARGKLEGYADNETC